MWGTERKKPSCSHVYVEGEVCVKLPSRRKSAATGGSNKSQVESHWQGASLLRRSRPPPSAESCSSALQFYSWQNQVGREGRGSPNHTLHMEVWNLQGLLFTWQEGWSWQLVNTGSRFWTALTLLLLPNVLHFATSFCGQGINVTRLQGVTAPFVCVEECFSTTIR